MMEGSDVIPHRPLAFTKMEQLVRKMQHHDTGIPTKSQKVFLTSVPCAFSGCDLVDWIVKQFNTEDIMEAMHIATLMYRLGYIYPVDTTKVTSVKNDNCLYRFQSPYFWPSQDHSHDNTDYAIFLAKRFIRSKQVIILEDYEQTAYNNLQRLLLHKWEFILLQAQEQNRIVRQRKTADRIIIDTQERAFWRTFYPPPGQVNALESDIRRKNSYTSPLYEKISLQERRNTVLFLQRRLQKISVRTSKAIESLMKHCSRYAEHDPMVCGVQPSNPWISDDTALWTLNTVLMETPTERRIRRWAISLKELIVDATGRHEFAKFLQKEYSQENIAFWEECELLKCAPQSSVPEKVNAIYRKYLEPGASCQINVDGATTDVTQQCLRNPNRFAFEAAQLQILFLMQKDSYPRFLQSAEYKELFSRAMSANPRKKFFVFGYPFTRNAKVAPDLLPFMKRNGSLASEIGDGFINGGELKRSISDTNLNELGLAHVYTNGHKGDSYTNGYNGDIHQGGEIVSNTRMSSRFGIWEPVPRYKTPKNKTVATIEIPLRRMSDSSVAISEKRSSAMIMSIPLPSKQTLIAPWEVEESVLSP